MTILGGMGIVLLVISMPVAVSGLVVSILNIKDILFDEDLDYFDKSVIVGFLLLVFLGCLTYLGWLVSLLAS